MLDSFRTLAGSIWSKILLGFLVLTFAVWGIGDMVRHPGRNVTVASVGDTSITSNDFLHVLRQDTEMAKQRMGGDFSPEMVKALQLPERALQKLVNHTLLKLEVENLGLIPSDGDVVRRIRNNPSFQDNKGNFNRALFEGMLRQSGLSEKKYIDQLRQDIAISLLLDTLVANVPVPDIEAQTLLAMKEQQRSATFYILNGSLVGTIPQPDEEQLKNYYNTHTKEFTTPEYRSLSYITLTNANARNNVAISEQDLQTAYKERIDEFKRPELRTLQQLLYNSEDKAQKAVQLLRNGKNFAQVAKETDALNKNSLSLGKVGRHEVLEAASDAVFSLHIGEYTDPVQSPFGWHVFYVTAIDEPSIASFEEAKLQLEKDLHQRHADNALSTLANQLEDTLAGGGTLEEVARELGVKVMSIGPINRQGLAKNGSKLKDTLAKDITDPDGFITTAFKTEEKTESSLATSKGGAYYIVRVDRVTPEHVQPLDEVKTEIVTGWQKEERGRRLAELAKTIATKFSDPATRGAVMEQYRFKAAHTATIKRSSTTAGDIAIPPILVQDLFARTPQKSTEAYPLANGDYVFAVMGSVIAAPALDTDPKLKSDLADIKRGLETTVQNEILEQYTRYLTKKYPVSIDESVLQSVIK